MTTSELKAYAVERYDAGYDVCVECYSTADWARLAAMSDAEALEKMRADVAVWALQISETKFG